MSFTPLSSITKNSKNIRIKVRVARKWDFSSTYNPGQIFSFELLLLDEEGSSIQCTIPDQISETFRKQLLEGNIYHISGFNVIEARKVYRISTHPYRIRLPENAFVKEINEPNSNIPYDTFNFIDLSSVMERVSSVDFLCDTFGQAIRVGRIQQKRIGPQIKNLRTIFAQDTDGFEVEFTLWEESASTFPIDDVLSVAATKPVIIAFVGMIVKPYNGSYTVNSTFATKLYINPPIPDISNFLLRLKKPYTKLTEIEYGPNQVADIESEKMTNRKTISELLDVDIHIDKEIKFTCQATIKSIDNTDGWWYRACPSCKGGVRNQEGKIWCKKCTYIDNVPIPWYRVTIIANDKTAEAPFVLFGHAATDLIGIPANNLTSKYPDRSEIPPMLSKLCGIEKIFQVQVSRRVDDPSNISYKVTHIFKDEFTTPKKETPSQSNVPSSHLFSPCNLRSSPKHLHTHTPLQFRESFTNSDSKASGSNIQIEEPEELTATSDSDMQLRKKTRLQ